jgi:NB-ARC domain/Bacterial transcriptional activator domain
MRALHVAGRSAEALERYAATRQLLAEELGTDPGPQLQRLHQSILRGDVLTPSATTTRAPVVPAQLPFGVAGFTGRIDQLARLDTLLRELAHGPTAVVISAVSGTAGVGKTALAVHWAHRVADRFPDGQLYVNLRGFDAGGQVMDPAEAVRRFLDALGVPAERIPVDLDAQAALYRSLLAGRRMLVVLDNARTTAQVRPLLPGARTCLVLVTSRNQLSGLVAADGAHPIILDLLTLDEAWELLARRLGSDRTTAEPDAVAEIITACARLPLALAIVGARAATHPHLPLHTLAGELRDSGDRLGTLTTDDPTTDVRAVFSWSYHALTPDAARLFRLLGLHPGPDISIAATASLAALSLPQVRVLLAELAGANLLVERTPNRYSLHDLLRAYAGDLAHTHDSDQQRHATTHRMLDHYLHTAHTAARQLYPARDPLPITPPQPDVVPEHTACCPPFRLRTV